jgi:DNA polymerase III delta prime subunit
MNIKTFNYTLSDLRPTYKYLALLIVVLAAGFLYYSYSLNVHQGLIVMTFIAVMLLLTRNLWTPKEYRKPLLTYFSLGGFWIVATAFITSYERVKPLLSPFIAVVNPLINNALKTYKFLGEIQLTVEMLNAFIVIILIMILFLINYIFRKNTIVLPHPVALKTDLPDLDIKAKIQALSQSLLTELIKIDKETNWSDYYFTPVDAEVEIISNHRKEKRITDLMKALKKNKKTRAFLILGDPGSGKSVALRKLAKELLNEASDTGRVALYINLKEWEPEIPWAESNGPTVVDVHQFIVRNIKGKLDLFGNNFMDDYFEKMHSQGRFFYIIDSFDEMPAVLDVSESSWLINDLSHAIYQFITSGVESRGIVASRIFRRPNKYFNSSISLEIRPLSDYKIKQNLERSEAFTEETSHLLFHTRADLLPLAANPFMAALLISFVKSNNGALPSLRSELFKSYINSRLDAASEKIEQLRLSKNIVTDYATEIAHYIFQRQKSGLEISLRELKKFFEKKPHNVEHVIQVLEYAKIAKLGKGNGSMFSFVHRRFNEYFVVQKMLIDDSLVNLESIPSDSRYRDALVLYCEVAPIEKALKIADFCWNFLNRFDNKYLKLTNETHVKAVFCLRFLKEAFMLRLECIEHFRNDLSKLILYQMGSKNFLLRKIVVETSSVINPKELQKAILMALNTSNPIIQEAGFKAGRYLSYRNVELDKTIVTYILQFDLISLLMKKAELRFALKLIPTFSKVYYEFKLLILDRYLLILGLLASLFSIRSIVAMILCYAYKKFLNLLFSYRLNFNKPTKDYSEAFENIDYQRQSVFGFLKKTLTPANVEFLVRCFFALLLVSFPSLRALNSSQGAVIGNSWLTGPGIYNEFYLFAIAALVIPKVDLYLVLRNFKINLSFFKKFLLFSCVSAIILGLGFFLLSLINERVLQYMIRIFGGISIAGMAMNFLIHYYKDKGILKSVMYYETMERKSIASVFESIFYSGNRMKYILLVGQTVKKVSGNWPNDVIPNYHDNASSALILLEEKWLNLEG